ncbi:MAG TPA: gamma-glutamyl-gamma-aminobutyrate hydrolase family protein [Candidatus Limnocylindria bacterium]|nr:gamma-glutamyl-gamma-aminobutyrate hydrolase family protein [Candidatus Limnocylindria bacterium]
MPSPPRILVTTHGPEQAAREEPTWQTFGRYVEAVHIAGGEAVLISPQAGGSERARALTEMDGLLLPGGADLDPARYGQPPHPTTAVEEGRDELELAAWHVARERGLPVLGVCRGMQAINVFSGGSLMQHVDGHDSPLYPSAEAHAHPMRLIGRSRLAGVLGLDGGSDTTLEVNTYHHQAIGPEQMGAGLAVAGTTLDGAQVEAFEAADPENWIFGVQNHPERPEFTPPEFARLWEAFVAAAAHGQRG